MILGLAALAASSVLRTSSWLVYNVSDSAPRGWYVVLPATHYRPDDFVLARLPEHVRVIANERGYLPASVPLLKRVGAVAGQQICVRRGIVYIDGAPLATTLEHDGMHRSLPAWSRCRVLLDNELFLLNPARADSFDSRYFGPLDASFIRGRAVPLFAPYTR
jgi:conjugative transfer signal peptidase TraF